MQKVKCDEAKPECRRCTSTSRKCDGYGGTSTTATVKVQWTGRTSAKPLTPPASRAVTPAKSYSGSASPIPIQPSSVFATDRERDAFSFFLNRTSPQMAGFYRCEFWNSVLPQAAHVDPGIRRAVIALSSVHRLFEETGDADGVTDAFGMQQYQLAIQQHISDMQSLEVSGDMATALAMGKGKEGLERYLASSMLFICIEMLQGHYVSAISLTKVAVRLFYEYIIPSTWDPTTHSTPFSAWPLAILENLLARLQAGAIGLVGRATVGVLIAPRTTKRQDWDCPTVPAKFASIADARDFLDEFGWAHVFSSHDPEIHDVQDDIRDPTMRKTHIAVMEAWSAAFAALLADLDYNRISQRDKNAIAVLQIRRFQIKISWEMVVRDELADCNPMLWDEHNAAFAETLQRIEPVLLTQDSTDRVPAPPSPLSQHTLPQTPRQSRHLFTLDFGLVAPLYEIARLCRDPTIRRKAINLLRAHPMREGMWDGLLAARAAEAQMELEEGMAREMLGIEKVETSEDIPRDARIIVLLPDFRPGQRWARTWFSKLPAMGPDPDRPKEWHFEQIIRW